MTHTTLLSNRSYLALTTFISIAVLSGIDYSSLALAVLLTAPVINFIIQVSVNKKSLQPTSTACR